ncbi:MAG: EpsG family protein [Bacteroides sp.]|nr:EpsG family protein [Bacteroides sp.]MCM1456399.1 EpsG family protein [Lachnoclostridium sp.]
MLLIFIFFPFLAFLFSLKDLRKQQNAIIFIAFYALFGYANHFALKTADISRIAYVFQFYDKYFDPINFLEPFLSGASADVYKNIIMSIVWHFTDNPKVFCGAIALVYGFLSYAVYVKVYELWGRKYDKYFYIYILICLSNISLVQLTGMRFFTGALLFILSAYNYIMGEKKWIIGIILAPFCHFALWMGLAGFLIYLLGKNCILRRKLCKIMLLLCFAFSFVNLGGISKKYLQQMNVENRAFNTKAGAYMHEDSELQESDMSGKSAYRQANMMFTSFFEIVCRAGLVIILIKLLNRQRQLIQSSKMKKFFAFCFLFSCMSVFAVGISDDIKRFICISWCLVLLYVAYLCGRNLNFNIRKYESLIFFSNFYWVCYLFINAPRLVDVSLWFLPVPYIILDGIGFRITW